MSAKSFKNYVVNYDLVVNATQTSGLATIEQIARSTQKPMKDIASHIGKMQKSINGIKNAGRDLKIAPTLDISSFDSQCRAMISAAEKTAQQISSILSGAFAVKPVGSGKAGGSPTGGTSSEAKQVTFTKDQLKKEADDLKSQLRNLYGPRGAMGAGTKGYKALLESLRGDVAKLEALKKLRLPYEAALKDLGKAKKSKSGQITKSIKETVKRATDEAKEATKTPAVSSALDGVIANLSAGKTIPIPVVASSEGALASLNSVLAKLRGEVKPIVIPITVATSVDAAKALRGTVAGLQGIVGTPSGKASGNNTLSVIPTSVITPSAEGKQSVTPTKSKKLTEERNKLNKELRGLKSEENKFNFWKSKHQEWQDKVAALKGSVAAPPNLPKEPKLASGVRSLDEINKRRAEINSRLAEIDKLLPVVPPTGAKGGKNGGKGSKTVPLSDKGAQVGKHGVKSGDLIQVGKNGVLTWFDGTPVTFYHGTENTKLKKATQLRPGHKRIDGSSATFFGKGLYFATDKTIAEEYGKNVLQSQLMMRNPYIMIGGDRIEDAKKAAAFTQKLIGQGYDGIIHYSGLGATPKERRKNRRAPTKTQLSRMSPQDILDVKNTQIQEVIAFSENSIPGVSKTGKNGEKKGGTKGGTGGKAPVTPTTNGIVIPPVQLAQMPVNPTVQQVATITANVIPNFIGGVGKSGTSPIPPIKVDVIPNFIGGTNKNGAKPIPPIKADVVPNFIGGTGKNGIKPIAPIKADVIPNFVSTTKSAGKKAAAAPIPVPVEGVIENVVVSNGVKVSGGPIKVEGLVDKVGLSKSAAVTVPDVTKQVASLKDLNSVWKQLPKTGKRTYTVTLKTPGIENLAKLKELIGIVGTMPPSTRRIYSGGIGGGRGGNGGAGGSGGSRGGGSGSGRSSYYLGGGGSGTRYIGRPKGTMNTFAYQLMGNTSLGARTPVFLDMMKGMGMMTGVGAAMGTLTNAFTNASEYQNTMVTARSILEANYSGSDFKSDFSGMERIVRDVAKKTKFTAPQAADAARFMAMAGLNIPMINASIRPVADVAVIGDNDLGEVADKITNIQTAFKIRPEKMRSLADALTKTFTSSNTDMMMLAESMEYAAPMAHLAGAQVEDALAMIGIMGNAGIQGSMAGTTLRMMYQNVINPNKKQSKMWKSLGIGLKDEKGDPRQLIDILNDLRQKVRPSKEDKDEEGKYKDEGTPIAEAVSKLFRVTASAGAGTLIENLDKVMALAEANRNAKGLSEGISLVKQNNVKGMWAKMTSAFTDAVVTEFEKNDSGIKGYLENVTKYLNSDKFKELLHDIFDLVTSMMDVLGDFAKIWKEILHTCGGFIKYVLMAQFYLTQIGYLLAPLRSVWMTISRGYGAAMGVMGSVGSMGNVGAMGAMGSVGSVGVGGLGSVRAMAGANASAAASALAAPLAAQSFLSKLNGPSQTGYFSRSGDLVLVDSTKNTALLRKPYATYAPLANPYMMSNPAYYPLPVGNRNLIKERKRIDKANRRIAEIQEGEQRYLNQRKRGSKKYQSWERLQVTSTSQQMVDAQRTAIRNASAMPFVPMPYLNFTKNANVPFAHGRNVSSITRTLSTGTSGGVLPFGKYADRASAVLYGGQSQAKFGLEYREKARKWYKYARMSDERLMQSGLIGAGKKYADVAAFREAALTNARTYGNEAKVWRQVYEMEIARQALTQENEVRAAKAIEQRASSRQKGGAVYERAKKIYGYKQNPFRAFGRGFIKAASWTPTAIGMTSILTRLSSVVGFVGKALGMLLNPIIIAVGAFISLGVASWNAVSKMNKMNEAIQNEAIEYGRKTNELINEFSSNSNLSSIFEGVKAVTIDSAIVNINKERKETPISSDEELKEFYNAITSNYRVVENSAGDREYFLDRKIKDSTIAEWYNRFVAPMNRYMPELPQTLEDFRNRNGGGGWAAALGVVDVVKAIHGKQGYETALEAQAEINKLYSELYKLDDKERKAKTPEYLERIQNIAESLNPKNKTWATSVTQDNVLEMAKMLPTEDVAYYETAYSVIQNYLKNSGIIKAIGSYNKMLDTPPLQFEHNEWSDVIYGIARSMPVKFTNANGVEKQISLPFDENGVLQRNKLSNTLKNESVYIAKPEETYTQVLINLYKQMLEGVPGFAERMSNIGYTEENFVKQSMNYGGTTMWGDNRRVDKIIDNRYPNYSLFPQQKDYSTNYTFNQQPVKPVQFVIEKIEINPTMKEEVNTEKMSEVLTKGITDYMSGMFSGGYKW